jgi:hypothetical protein
VPRQLKADDYQLMIPTVAAVYISSWVLGVALAMIMM